MFVIHHSGGWASGLLYSGGRNSGEGKRLGCRDIFHMRHIRNVRKGRDVTLRKLQPVFDLAHLVHVGPVNRLSSQGMLSLRHPSQPYGAACKCRALGMGITHSETLTYNRNDGRNGFRKGPKSVHFHCGLGRRVVVLGNPVARGGGGSGCPNCRGSFSSPLRACLTIGFRELGTCAEGSLAPSGRGVSFGFTGLTVVLVKLVNFRLPRITSLLSVCMVMTVRVLLAIAGCAIIRDRRAIRRIVGIRVCGSLRWIHGRRRRRICRSIE